MDGVASMEDWRIPIPCFLHFLDLSRVSQAHWLGHPVQGPFLT